MDATRHWSQCSSHDDLCALNELSTTANDEVLSSLFSRGHCQASLEHSVHRGHQMGGTPSPEGTQGSARMDFVQGTLPAHCSTSQPLLRPPMLLGRSRNTVSITETSRSYSAELQPSGDPSPPHRRDSYRDSSPVGAARRASFEVTEIPSTLELCGTEIKRLRALLDAERTAVQKERIRRAACEAELALLHNESKGQGLNAAAAAGDVDKLRSLAKVNGVNTVGYVPSESRSPPT